MNAENKIQENLEILNSLNKDQRAVLFEFMGEIIEYRKTSYEKTFKFLNNLEKMTEDESDEMYKKVGIAFCTSCGDKNSEDHECEFEDEDEEEDEDE